MEVLIQEVAQRDDIYATSGVINTSDITLKENIKSLDYGLNEIMKLKPISYVWKKNRIGETVIPDDLDWNDEIRLCIEERTSFSPDALTGLEANLRFPGKESCETKIFGRLSAWQNWIFNRPNASSDNGALKLFGTGSKAKFDNKRV